MFDSWRASMACGGAFPNDELDAKLAADMAEFNRGLFGLWDMGSPDPFGPRGERFGLPCGVER